MTGIQKRIAVGAIIRDDKDRVLIVKPSYKGGWLLPGGLVESGELPTQTCEREVMEEIGIKVDVGRLLCVDYGPKDEESVILIFDCGVLSEDTVFECSDGEIIEFRFADIEQARQLLRPKGAHRLPRVIDALRSNSIVYIEDNVNSI